MRRRNLERRPRKRENNRGRPHLPPMVVDWLTSSSSLWSLLTLVVAAAAAMMVWTKATTAGRRRPVQQVYSRSDGSERESEL